jgi:hypothetical protein
MNPRAPREREFIVNAFFTTPGDKHGIRNVAGGRDMEILLAALLAGKTIADTIDHNSLELQARAESLQPRMAPPRPVVRRASSAGSLDFASITTICRAAGHQADPSEFVGRLSRAYSLSNAESASLRSSCAAYLTGRADARRNAQ